MKRLCSYIGIHKRKSTALFFGLGILFSLLLTLILMVCRLGLSDSTEVMHFSLIPSITFLPLLFFFTVMITINLYGVHMQFNISRRTGLGVLFTYLLMMILVTSALSLLLEFVFSKVFNVGNFGYEFHTLAQTIGFTDNSDIGGVLISYAVNLMICLLPVTGALMIIVPGMFLRGKTLAAIYGTIYLIFMIGMTFGEEIYNPIWLWMIDVFGGVGALLVLMLGFEAVVLIITSLLYLRTSYQENPMPI